MVREYLKQNVYEALQDRMKFIFEEFDNLARHGVRPKKKSQMTEGWRGIQEAEQTILIDKNLP